jgi:hypothetical protein
VVKLIDAARANDIFSRPAALRAACFSPFEMELMDRPKSAIQLLPAIPIDGPSAAAARLSIARDILGKLRAAGMPCELIMPDDEADDERTCQ